MNFEENAAYIWFQYHRFTVNPIVPASELGAKRADLFASDTRSTYLVEVTHKEPGKEFELLSKNSADAAAELLSDKGAKGFASVDRVVGRYNRLSNIIDDETKQLRDTPAPGGTFRLIWVHFSKGDAAFLARQFEVTLYGSKDVSVVSINRSTLCEPRICFYCDYATFYSNRDVDAVVLAGPEGLHLCVNDLSPRAPEFRETELYILFRDKGGLIDPLMLEEKERAFVIRGEVDRKNWQAVWSYVERTYGYYIAPMHCVQFTGQLSVPRSVIEEAADPSKS